METNEVSNEQKSAFVQSAFQVAVLFGMWLQQKEQRKRLAKEKITELYSEWITELSKKYED